MKEKNLSSIFESFNDLTVLVVGDVMIDSYYWGRVNRISPEAPVPVVSIENKESRLGGAANVALNLMTMGAKPVICSVIGSDEKNREFYDLLAKRDFSKDGIIESEDRVTTVKTRVISGGHHMLRVDEEVTTPLSQKDEEAFVTRIQKIVEEQKPAVIVFEDYNKGVLTKGVIEKTIAIAQENDIPTTVDPKKDNFFEYKNVTLFKPNLKELREGLNRPLPAGNFSALSDAIAELEGILENQISLVTLSEHGVYVKSQGQEKQIPAHLREILDVSGAGDTVISVASLALAAGMDPEDIAELSNLAGGLVCEKVGVVPIDKTLLLREALKL
ncbi:bifunctional heptose 7-phosphate kinase/heptose 1-phosphate adenyltransferase [Halocola ammonii]